MLIIVIGVWIGYFVSKKWYAGEKRDALGVGVYCFVGGMLFWMIGIAISTQFTIPQGRMELVSKVELVSLKNTNPTSGSFYLGTGSIGDDQYYSYYRKVGKDGYRPQRLEFADNITVYEDTYEPFIVKYNKYSGRIVNPKLIPWIFIFSDLSTAQSDEVIEIHIPKNTLKRNFVLD